jgi:hypothetical protein
MKQSHAILQGDRLIQDFGMTQVEACDRYAKGSVVVADRVLNAHRIGHGVLLFAAADDAFARDVGKYGNLFCCVTRIVEDDACLLYLWSISISYGVRSANPRGRTEDG